MILHAIRGAAIGALLTVFLISTAIGEDKAPLPTVVNPGAPGSPPADAIVLFDGKDTSHWTSDKGKPYQWDLIDGAMVCKAKAGSIVSTDRFEDAQIHVEFNVPLVPNGKGQDRGNSGVYMQGKYEIQVLDSYQSETYPNGQCGAVYGEYPPLVNVCRPPTEWQTYDIIFRAPRFGPDGKRTEQGVITAFQNGVLIQDHVKIGGSTTASLYKEGPGDGPLVLQDHDFPVKYRNIWIRKLGPPQAANK